MNQNGHHQGFLSRKNHQFLYCDYVMHNLQNCDCFLLLNHFNGSKSSMARGANEKRQLVDKHEVHCKCHISISCQNINWQGVSLISNDFLRFPSGCLPFRERWTKISLAASTSRLVTLSFGSRLLLIKWRKDFIDERPIILCILAPIEH